MKKLSLIAAALFTATVAAQPLTVTPDDFADAEMDARITRFVQAGGMNYGLQYSEPTPLDKQPVPRMNRDTLYAGIPVDTSKGFTIEFPEHPEDLYVSAYILDNQHYTIDILKGSGETFTFDEQMDTRYIVIIPRVEVGAHTNPEDVARAREVLAGFKVTSGSMVEKEIPNWDWQTMLELRSGYEQDFLGTEQYPSDWQGARGEVNEETRNVAIGTSWGLFPETETVYINQSVGDASQCYVGTFEIPEHSAFWSTTIYDGEGYMFSEDRSNFGSHTATYNEDGTVTVLFGSLEQCGSDVNRVDTTDGWSMLMRVYEPGQSVIDGNYKLPELKPM